MEGKINRSLKHCSLSCLDGEITYKFTYKSNENDIGHVCECRKLYLPNASPSLDYKITIDTPNIPECHLILMNVLEMEFPLFCSSWHNNFIFFSHHVWSPAALAQ